MKVTIREAEAADARGIAQLGLENTAYYVRLAPELFRTPDEGYERRAIIFRKPLS